MRRALLSLVALAFLAASPSMGETFAASLTSTQEVPAISSGPAGGTFVAERDANGDYQYILEYGGTRGNVLQAHIHIGQAGVNGGIMVFLCSNLGNGPQGTQACPAEGEISGLITRDDILPVTAQGVTGPPAALRNRLLVALRNKAGYVNVHTDLFPGGEIRGQLVELEE